MPSTSSKKKQQQDKIPLHLSTVYPMTPTQSLVFDAYKRDQNLILHGYAGTGKTFCALYLAFNELIKTQCKKYDRIIIIRSVVPSREMGFLPGSIIEKSAIYEEPYREICDTLFNKFGAYDALKKGDDKLLEFHTTSFLRGLTFNNAIVIVDEMQNMNWGELSTVMTRMGDNTKFIFAGDFRQTDFQFERDKQGLKDFLDIVQKMHGVETFEFKKDDIVRSGIVKEFIIKSADFFTRKHSTEKPRFLVDDFNAAA